MRLRNLTRAGGVIVTEILRRPAHGLAISRRTGLSVPSVFKALVTLEKAGFVEGRWEEPDPAGGPPCRIYHVTAAGRVELAAWRAAAPAARTTWLNVTSPAAWAWGPDR
ncbi:PadR family transcriptional regulator [Actinoplanes sp. NPDC000266]